MAPDTTNFILSLVAAVGGGGAIWHLILRMFLGFMTQYEAQMKVEVETVKAKQEAPVPVSRLPVPVVGIPGELDALLKVLIPQILQTVLPTLQLGGALPKQPAPPAPTPPAPQPPPQIGAASGTFTVAQNEDGTFRLVPVVPFQAA